MGVELDHCNAVVMAMTLLLSSASSIYGLHRDRPSELISLHSAAFLKGFLPFNSSGISLDFSF